MHTLPVQSVYLHRIHNHVLVVLETSPGLVKPLFPEVHLDLPYLPSPLLTVPEPRTPVDTLLVLVQRPYLTLAYVPPEPTDPPLQMLPQLPSQKWNYPYFPFLGAAWTPVHCWCIRQGMSLHRRLGNSILGACHAHRT